MDAVTADLRHYEAQADADQSNEFWIEAKAREVYYKWMEEFGDTGIILDLDMELGDMKLYAQEVGRDLEPWEVVEELAFKYVEDNEEALKDAEVCWE